MPSSSPSNLIELAKSLVDLANALVVLATGLVSGGLLFRRGSKRRHKG